MAKVCEICEKKVKLFGRAFVCAPPNLTQLPNENSNPICSRLLCPMAQKLLLAQNALKLWQNNAVVNSLF